MCGGYNDGICETCIRQLPRTEQGSQRQNSTEYVLAGEVEDFVNRMKVMHLDRAAAFLHYEKEHPIQRAIHKMKYADQPMIGYQLGKQAAIEMQYADFFDGIDLIIPLPLHPKRLRSRGYNQSDFIARGISEVTGTGGHNPCDAYQEHPSAGIAARRRTKTKCEGGFRYQPSRTTVSQTYSGGG